MGKLIIIVVNSHYLETIMASKRANWQKKKKKKIHVADAN